MDITDSICLNNTNNSVSLRITLRYLDEILFKCKVDYI